MRHGKKFNHLGRKSQHRKAMLSNMATSLIINKRIFTTTAKAKALKKYVEPLITKSKDDSTNSRRVVFSYLQDKNSVTELFNEVAARVATRPGGYTRIIKTGNRLGDNADMCMIELVDYNELYGSEAKPAKAKTRRSRRGAGDKKPDSTKDQEVKDEVVVAKVDDTSKEDHETKAEVAIDEKVEEVQAEETKSTEEDENSKEGGSDEIENKEEK